MRISFVVAMSENRVIGNSGQLPWRLPNDLKNFKRLTINHDILMGRKTFASIKKPLPNRNNMVLTKNPNFAHDSVRAFHSKEEVLASGIEDLIVIGGEEIYRLFMPECFRIYLTLVHTVVEGDAFFPAVDERFVLKDAKRFHKDDSHAYDYSFLKYDRRG